MTTPGAAQRSRNGTRNQLLASLPPEEYERLAPHLERIALDTHQILFDVNQVIDHVYFPENCVGSIIGLMANGAAVESATVGYEGMIGLPIFHGTDRTSSQAFCQVPGDALKLPADVFRKEIGRSESLTRMLHRYTLAIFTLVAQSSACNRLHLMEQRCARWLLHTHDRVSMDVFPLTHQFLSQMLGVRRATVTETMSALHETGAIDYERGIITVLDRQRLEAHACECYGIARSEFDRLLGTDGSTPMPNPLEGMTTSRDGKSIVGDAVPGDAPRDIG